MPASPAPTNHPGLAYRPSVDGLRAIAVLGVVLYHAGFGPPGGFVGVDVFFVISGFLITSLLEAELARSGRIDMAAFYARRVRRLLPALGVVLVATVAGCFAILSPYGELTSALRSVAAACVFGANVFFQYTTGGYFGPNVNHLPLLHLWSLGVEEQYYVLWPLALWMARRLPLGARRALFLACAAASLAFAEWMLFRGNQAAFYAMPSRWWELSLGALVAWAPSPTPRAGRVEGVAGFMVILLAMAFPTQHFPGIGAVPATVGAALVVHASSVEGGIWRLLASRPMVLVGRVSYPLYLWHWPILALAAVAIPGDVPIISRAALVLIAFLLALGTWRWIETPVRQASGIAPRKLVGAALALSVAAGVFSLQMADVMKATAPSSDPSVLASRDLPANIYRCHANSFAPPTLPDPAECTLGGKGKPSIVIWGDSHALALQPFATALAKSRDQVAIAYSRDACAPALDYDNGERPTSMALCKAFNNAAFASAKTMDTVILASRWPNPGDRHFADDLTATIDALASHVKHVVVIGATPDLPASVPDCMFRHALGSCEVTRAAFEQRSAPIRAVLSALPARHPNVVYIDPTDFFCTPERCPGVRYGMALYWDDNHISSTAAAAFGRSFLAGKQSSAL